MTERDNRAQDLLRTLLAEGWSQAEIARRIGRDPRLVRFVLKGLKPGTNLVSALTQLARGEDVTPPPRRCDRKGRAAKVRSKSGRPVSYTHLRAHETVLDLVCRLLLDGRN